MEKDHRIYVKEWKSVVVEILLAKKDLEMLAKTKSWLSTIKDIGKANLLKVRVDTQRFLSFSLKNYIQKIFHNLNYII